LLRGGLVGIVDFWQLTHLTLLQCSSLSEFLAALVKGTNREDLKLGHLALDIPIVIPSSEQSFDRDFDLVLRRCKRLRSFCLECSYSDVSRPRCILNALQHVGDELKLLSLHRRKESSDDAETLEPEQLRQMCNLCPNLEQLGYQISDKMLLKDVYRYGTYNNIVSLPASMSSKSLTIPTGLDSSAS
jgi:hypothetical protein